MPSPRFSFGKMFKKVFGGEAKFERTGRLRPRAKPSVEAIEERITPAVHLDPTFGAGGKVFTDFQVNVAPSSEAKAVTVQSDGKILAAGDGGLLVRLNVDGSLDNTFGSEGMAPFAGTVASIAIDGLGRIVVAGSISTETGIDFAVARYNADGSPDTTFDGDGFVVTHLASSINNASGVAIDASGRIVVAGYSGELDVWLRCDFALVRYNVDGSLDTSFDGDGIVITSFGSFDDRAKGVAIDSMGRIVAVGLTCITDYSGDGNDIDFAVARYNDDGSLDTSFDGDGKSVTSFGNGKDEANGVAIDSAGRVVVAGYAGGGSFALARYNVNGSLDSAFDLDGKLTFGNASYLSSVAIDGSNRIVAAGYAYGEWEDFAVIRLNSNGSLDTSFDTDGIVLTPIGTTTDQANSVAVDPQGRIVAAGWSFNAGVRDLSVVRYIANGSLDTAFDGDGKKPIQFRNSQDFASAMAVDSSGNIVVAGSSMWDFAVARYLPNGKLDATFDSDGKLRTNFGFNETASAVAIDGSGRIVVAGYANTGSKDEIFVSRYDTDGTLDSSFDLDGKVRLAIGSASAYVYSMTIDASGRIVLAGETSNNFLLVRLNDDGTLDETFDGDGIAITDFGGSDFANSVTFDGAGGIVAAGHTTNAFAVARYKSDGSLDAAFGVLGKVKTSFGSSYDTASKVAIDGSGRIVTVGFTAANGGNWDFAAARYLTDGSLDSTFGTAGKAVTPVGGSTDVAKSLAFDAAGRIVVVGHIEVGSDWDIGLIRYTANGVLDTTFGSDGKIILPIGSGDDSPADLMIDNIGRMLVVGTSLGNREDFALLRILPSVPTPLVSLQNDTGLVGDRVTANGALLVSGVVDGATMEYSIDGGLTWSTSFSAAEGSNSVRVRQSDLAGYKSAASAAFVFTLDTSVPTAPGVALQSDTGINGDKVTSNGTLSLTGVEQNAAVQYSIDGGDTWTSGFTATPGANAVRVRQTDLAGNVSQASNPFEFTLDTAAPATPSIALTNDTGLLPADRVTKDGSLSLTGIEANAAVEYLANGSSIWSSSFAPVQGANSVQVRQTDTAGNVSLVSDALTFTLDNSTPATPTIALTSDTGANGSDKLTKNGNLALGGTEANALVEYSTDGTHWSASFSPIEGPNSVQIRQTDVAGNTSIASAAFAFALDTTAATADSISAISPNPRTTAVTSLDVVFSEAIDLATFGYADLVLQRNGGGNLISGSSGVSISATADPKTYRVQLPSALTAASGAYTFRVTAVGIFDLSGNASTNDVQTTWSTTVNATPGVPTITGPAGIVNDATPTITWTTATYAARYDLWIDNLTTGASQVIRQQNIAGTSFTPTSNLPFGSYRAWVRSISDAGVASAWSVATDFRSATPAITGPVGTSANATPTITWSAVDGAARYDLWLDNQTTGAAQVVRRTDLTSASFTPTSALPAGLYRGWVRAFDAAGNATSWSAASEFSIGIPSVTGPVGTAPSSTPTITWTALADATRYELWVDNLTTGASQVVRQTNVATNSFAISTALASGQYRVWVRAFNASGTATAWSKAFDFRVGIPTVTAPTGVVLTATPTITWTAIAGTLRYDLWVDNLTTGQSPAIRQTNLTTASFTPSNPLTANSTYRVWVRAFDTQGRPSAWSAFADFTIGSLV
jgi:uncharacterized delta-60 repeat protein